MLNIVIPMAGRGSRFQTEGYDIPKPLISIHGRPMIEVVINNLKPKCEHKFIFICLEEHKEEFMIDDKLKIYVPECEIVWLNKITKGAACTVLSAKEFINNDNTLMIANSDQWVDININDYIESMEMQNARGLIMTMEANDPKWSFVKFDAHGEISEVVEKEVVSNEATVGIYNFKYGSDYVRAAETMIKKNLRVNNEFYVAPTYNQLIEEGCKIAYYNIGKVGDGMYGLGTPADLEKFLAMEISQKAANF